MNFDLGKVLSDLINALPNITPLKIIILTICLCTGWVFYISAPTISNFLSVVFADPKADKLKVTVSNENISIINKYIAAAIDKNSDIAMITVFQFVPNNDNFYQGRMLVTSATANKTIDVNTYNLKWLPISAFRIQINKILNNAIYYESIHDILYDKLSIDNKVNRSDYDSPINFNLMYSNGMRYMVSVPIVSSRAVGLVTVYFASEPKDDAALQAQIEAAKTVTVNIGYYISY